MTQIQDHQKDGIIVPPPEQTCQWKHQRTPLSIGNTLYDPLIALLLLMLLTVAINSIGEVKLETLSFHSFALSLTAMFGMVTAFIIGNALGSHAPSIWLRNWRARGKHRSWLFRMIGYILRGLLIPLLSLAPPAFLLYLRIDYFPLLCTGIYASVIWIGFVLTTSHPIKSHYRPDLRLRTYPGGGKHKK